jgi:glycosyltransferase involved in cell wall biosynthesis
MTRPFLSIVTISFNQASFLRQCLESVISQKSNDVEYIVADPGSTDGSRAIIEEYRNFIDCIILDPDGGPAHGLNKAFSFSKGEFGYFINSDDFMLPGSIDFLRKFWQKHNEADVFLGSGWMVNKGGLPMRELNALDDTLEKILASGTMVQQGMSFRMEFFNSVGGFNPANRSSWDFELLCRMLSSGAQCRKSAKRLGAFRFYDSSLSGGRDGALHASRYENDMKRIREEFGVGQRMAAQLLPKTFCRVFRHMMHPVFTFRRICDLVFPKLMRRRWDRDSSMTVD